MTGHVLLRDVTEDDLLILFEHQLDPDANQMAAFAARDWDAFAAHWAKVLRDETVDKKTVLFDRNVAGNVLSFTRLDERLVGYWIGREYWGKGIATEALSQFLDLVEGRPLHARVAKHNIGSIRVLEKCGFRIFGEDKVSDEHGEGEEEFIMKLEAT